MHTKRFDRKWKYLRLFSSAVEQFVAFSARGISFGVHEFGLARRFSSLMVKMQMKSYDNRFQARKSSTFLANLDLCFFHPMFA